MRASLQMSNATVSDVPHAAARLWDLLVNHHQSSETHDGTKQLPLTESQPAKQCTQRHQNHTHDE